MILVWVTLCSRTNSHIPDPQKSALVPLSRPGNLKAIIFPGISLDWDLAANSIYCALAAQFVIPRVAISSFLLDYYPKLSSRQTTALRAVCPFFVSKEQRALLWIEVSDGNITKRRGLFESAKAPTIGESMEKAGRDLAVQYGHCNPSAIGQPLMSPLCALRC